jgi:hypothetical protein
MFHSTFSSFIRPPPLQLTASWRQYSTRNETEKPLQTVVSVLVSRLLLSLLRPPVTLHDRAGVPRLPSSSPLILFVLLLSSILTEISAFSSPPVSHPEMKQSYQFRSVQLWASVAVSTYTIDLCELLSVPFTHLLGAAFNGIEFRIFWGLEPLIDHFHLDREIKIAGFELICVHVVPLDSPTNSRCLDAEGSRHIEGF